MRPLKSSSSSLEVKFKFVDGSMCVVCVYVCVHVHLEFRDVFDQSHCQSHDTRGYHKVDKSLMIL